MPEFCVKSPEIVAAATFVCLLSTYLVQELKLMKRCSPKHYKPPSWTKDRQIAILTNYAFARKQKTNDPHYLQKTAFNFQQE
jgi:hypothetical protein